MQNKNRCFSSYSIGSILPYRITFLIKLFFYGVILLISIGNPPSAVSGIINPVQIDEWTYGILIENENEDWYSFKASQGSEYIITAVGDSLERYELYLYDTDGILILKVDLDRNSISKKIGFICEKSDTYYVVVRSYANSIGTYKIAVLKISDRIKRAMELIYNNRTGEALVEYQTLLNANPDDPELNLHIAILRLIDILESPDERFIKLLDAFGAKIDLFPSTVIIMDASSSTENISEIQSYVVDTVLPKVDESLKNLEKIQQQNEIRILLPLSIVPGAQERVEIDWIEVDKADVEMLSGFTLILKSMILAVNAFDVGIEPKVIYDQFEDPAYPTDFDSLLIEYPNLLSGKLDVQKLFQASLSNWLLGTDKMRNGLSKMEMRRSIQEVHLFYTKPGFAENLARYLVLLDRVFISLLKVTGGDLNGDTSVDYWDLHDLRLLLDNQQWDR
jgi:hypothetical protein